MPHQVICPKCQKEFTVPPEHGDVWQMCPYCSDVNTAALVRLPSALGCLGTVLFASGICGGTLGTFLACLGIGLSRQSELLIWIWALCSVAIGAVGVRLLRADQKIAKASPIWGPGGMFAVIALLAVCGWVFVFAICTSKPFIIGPRP
jgi:hypothetical protein